jgi:hypothetical protein
VKEEKTQLPTKVEKALDLPFYLLMHNIYNGACSVWTQHSAVYQEYPGDQMTQAEFYL